MPQQSALDPIAILAALGVAGADAVTPVSGGADTAIWRVVYGERAYALRVFRAEQAAVCRREVAAMRAAQAAGLPIPAIQVVGRWEDRPALLLEWCAGVPLLNALTRQPWRIGSLGMAFGRMQARIHAVRPASSPDLPADAWLAWAGADEQALQQRLRALSADANRLLHLDYHPLNVMTDGRQITAVLDWANARVGDPRADVARTYTILAIDPAWPRQPHVSVFRWLLVRAWRRGYEQVAGRQGALAIFYAWAGAVMLRDQAHRLSPAQLEPVRSWTALWKRRAGVV